METHHFSSVGGLSVPEADRPKPSCVSMKSDDSMIHPPGLSSERAGIESRADRPEPSCVSMKSDDSMIHPPGLSSERAGIESRTDRPEPRCVSMKSDDSMIHPPGLSSERAGVEPRADRPEPSCVSMKSDDSMIHPPGLSSERAGVEPRTDRPKPSCVSMKSDDSMIHPPGLSSERAGVEPRADRPEPSCVSMKSDDSMIHPPGLSSERAGIESSSGKENLLQDQFSCAVCQQLPPDPVRWQCINRNWNQSAPSVDSVCSQCRERVLERHKTSMKKKYESLFEGTTTLENKTLLNKIYTELYILEGESEGVNEEHEVLQMEKTYKKYSHNTPISCSDIFKPIEHPKGETQEKNFIDVTGNGVKPKERKEDEEPKPLRTVLTKGIAGIGKTVSVQKFILDWAEGKANQDIDFMFVLPFRELNLIEDHQMIKDHQYSLHGLLCVFHPELKELDQKVIDVCNVVFIFDGLDESRIALNFEECEKMSDITKTSSVGVLITNLFRGELLPAAHIWITSRPAAANQIPSQYIGRMTEIQGFNNTQKKEYFRKKVGDPDEANKIISHIKTARSLHIMCHIPVFCWISATVLQNIMKQSEKTEIPKTLTEMYSHFLLTQTKRKNEKFATQVESDLLKVLEHNRDVLLKLAELAFKHLMKESVMFYEEDLKECGIDATDAVVYSGICTEILKEESVIHHRKIYCFVHLSFQEFLAAFYVFHCYASQTMEPLHFFNPQWTENVPLNEVLTKAVDKALESANGHLDLFLRFLLGISLACNQKLLQALLTQQKESSEGISKTAQYIKDLIQSKDLPAERSINLFLCLTEMNDQSLSREIEEYLKSEKCSETKLSAAHCSAIAYMLQVSEEVLDELDPKKFNTSEEGYRRLVLAVSKCRKARLANCNLTVKQCKTICSDLKSADSFLKELDISGNELHDSGVELLCAGLKTSHCKLEILRLAVCNLGVRTCENLRLVLKLESSSLKELDVSQNELQDLGVELLSAGLKSSHCKLEVLRLAMCQLTAKSCDTLKSVFHSENCSLKELDLSNNDLHDSGVEQLSVGLKSSCCKLEILRLSGCMVTEDGCSFLESALRSSHSRLKDLDLTYNHPGESGVQLLSAILEDPQYLLNTLRMKHGGENRIQPGLKKYSREFTLDPNTAHTEFSLSAGNKKAERLRSSESYSDHPERFDVYGQVLSRESVTGRCYWEVEWSGRVNIAVTYKSISRKGRTTDCDLGRNKKSWTLFCSDYSYSVRHNNKATAVSTRPSSCKRVGVYVDCPAGTLSFYSICPDTHALTHLYTFYTSFTETLHAGFTVWSYNSTGSVCLM